MSRWRPKHAAPDDLAAWREVVRRGGNQVADVKAPEHMFEAIEAELGERSRVIAYRPNAPQPAPSAEISDWQRRQFEADLRRYCPSAIR